MHHICKIKFTFLAMIFTIHLYFQLSLGYDRFDWSSSVPILKHIPFFKARG